MFLLSLFLVNICFALFIKIYLKLTCGVCKSSRHLVGKVVLVTGADSPIGFETAKDLAKRGAKVIITSKTEEKAKQIKDELIKISFNENVVSHCLNYTSFQSVTSFVNKIYRTEKRIDVLINNEESFSTENITTEDGLLQVLQANYYGPFLMTHRLLPLLESSAPSRIVNVTSMTRNNAKELDFNYLKLGTVQNFDARYAYVTSKLYCVLWTVELARRVHEDGITVNCAYLGAVENDILNRKYSSNKFHKLISRILKFYYKTPWEGAQTTIYLAVSSAVQDVSGCCFRDCLCIRSRGLLEDRTSAFKLWEVTERLVKLK